LADSRAQGGTELHLGIHRLAEISTRQTPKAPKQQAWQNQTAARSGGRIARKARLDLESKTGKPVVTGANFLPPQRGLSEKKR